MRSLSSRVFASILALSGATMLVQACSSSSSGGGAAGTGGAGNADSGSSTGGETGNGGSDNASGGETGTGGSDNASGGQSNGGAGDGGDAGTAGADGGPTKDGGPVALPSTTALGIAAGRLHSCAVTAAGGVRCWGDSNVGQLGNGAPMADVSFPLPVAVTGIGSGATAIASTSDYACAIVGGGVKCWGIDDAHELGGSSVANSAVPVTVAGLSGVKAISAGEAHTCVLTSANGVQCWGQNSAGELGNDTTDDSGTPVDVTGLTSGVISVAAGRFHSCAVTTGGAVKCWGSNDYGELGNDSTDASHVPVGVTGLDSGVVSVAAGDSVTCAILSTGAAKCWGKNSSGQLGNGDSGTLVESHVPVDVTGLTAGVTSIAPGYDYTCAVVAGAAKCWGENSDGTLGNGQGPGFLSATPVAVTGLTTGVLSVASSAHHVCAIIAGNALKCWGSGGAGELGNGGIDDSTTPVSVVSFP